MTTNNISVQYNGGLLPDIILDPRLPLSGNPCKYHVEVMSLQPMKRYIITTMFDDVLLIHCLFRFCFCFLSGVPAWRLII